MAALPFKFTGDEEETLLPRGEAVGDHAPLIGIPTRAAPGPETPPPAGTDSAVPALAPAERGGATARALPRQFTPRALTIGIALGALLAAGNVYTGLKSSFIDGGALTAALLSFTFFATFKRLGRIPFGPLENNIAQTVASSAAVMGFVHGLMAAMPALHLLGRATPPWALWLWGLSLALIGVVLGALLRRKLIVEDALPFPTGTATAELIRTVHARHGSAVQSTRLLLWAGLAAAVLTWFRDGRPAVIPQAFYWPLTIGGLAAASLTVGVATSPLMIATGMFIGLRTAVSLMVGATLAWALMAPTAVHSGWVKDGGYAVLTSWLIWPALGMMLASALVPPLLAWRTIGQAVARTLRDTRNVLARRRGADEVDSGPIPGVPTLGVPVGVATLVLASVALAWTGWSGFGFSPLLTALALLLSVVLSAVCARAAGETDIAPVGSFGTMTQFAFASTGPTGSILSGGVISGTSSAVAQTMWAFKTGHNLKASVRAQIVAQILGAVVGSIVVVPAYLLIIAAYPLGTERMPAVSAVSWKATAVALTSGVSGLPPHGLHAAGLAFALGAILCILARTRAARFFPSPVAMGIAMITPFSLSATALVGAGAIILVRRRFPKMVDGEVSALAAGLLAGESILGVLIAALTTLAILK